MIVTSGAHAVRAAQRATSVIPIVMAIVEDPIEQGFVTSLARPGGNLTGLSFQDSELVTKRLQLLKEAIPEVSRVAVLWDSIRPNAFKAVERAAPQLSRSGHDDPMRIAEKQIRAHAAQLFESKQAQLVQPVVNEGSPFRLRGEHGHQAH